MTQITAYVCDRCGTEGKGTSPFHLSVYLPGQDTLRRDLCAECLLDLTDWIDEGLTR